MSTRVSTPVFFLRGFGLQQLPPGLGEARHVPPWAPTGARSRKWEQNPLPVMCGVAKAGSKRKSQGAAVLLSLLSASPGRPGGGSARGRGPEGSGCSRDRSARPGVASRSVQRRGWQGGGAEGMGASRARSAGFQEILQGWHGCCSDVYPQKQRNEKSGKAVQQEFPLIRWGPGFGRPLETFSVENLQLPRLKLNTSFWQRILHAGRCCSHGFTASPTADRVPRCDRSLSIALHCLAQRSALVRSTGSVSLPSTAECELSSSTQPNGLQKTDP